MFMPMASAANVFGACSSTTAQSTNVCQTVGNQPTTSDPITKVLKIVIGILGVVIGIAAVIVIMISGFTFIVNGGDPQAVTRARNQLIYAIVGVVIAVMAESIVFFIIGKV